jgi:XRE family transcriptional regulator, regulator of sulfur utilization
MTVQTQDDILALMAKRLAEYRAERNLTIEEFADLLGTTPRTLYRIARGETVPRPTTIRRFAKALGVQASEITELARASEPKEVL